MDILARHLKFWKASSSRRVGLVHNKDRQKELDWRPYSIEKWNIRAAEDVKKKAIGTRWTFAGVFDSILIFASPAPCTSKENREGLSEADRLLFIEWLEQIQDTSWYKDLVHRRVVKDL